MASGLSGMTNESPVTTAYTLSLGVLAVGAKGCSPMKKGSVMRVTVLMFMPVFESASMSAAPRVSSAKMVVIMSLMRSKSAVTGWVMTTPTPVFDLVTYAEACMNAIGVMSV